MTYNCTLLPAETCHPHPPTSVHFHAQRCLTHPFGFSRWPVCISLHLSTCFDSHCQEHHTRLLVRGTPTPKTAYNSKGWVPVTAVLFAAHVDDVHHIRLFVRGAKTTTESAREVEGGLFGAMLFLTALSDDIDHLRLLVCDTESTMLCIRHVVERLLPTFVKLA